MVMDRYRIERYANVKLYTKLVLDYLYLLNCLPIESY